MVENDILAGHWMIRIRVILVSAKELSNKKHGAAVT